MSKAVKELVTSTYRKQYADVSEVCVADVTKLDVGSITRVRADLCAKGIELHVVKNSLARRAFAKTPMEPIGEALAGPCALVTGGDSIIDVAKALVEAAKEFDKLELKQAMLEGDPNLLTVEQLSLMMGRKELVGELAMLVASPGRALAGSLRSPAGKIAGCLQAMVDKAA